MTNRRPHQTRPAPEYGTPSTGDLGGSFAFTGALRICGLIGVALIWALDATDFGCSLVLSWQPGWLATN
jgi:hypothetical protein